MADEEKPSSPPPEETSELSPEQIKNLIINRIINRIIEWDQELSGCAPKTGPWEEMQALHDLNLRQDHGNPDFKHNDDAPAQPSSPENQILIAHLETEEGLKYFPFIIKGQGSWCYYYYYYDYERNIEQPPYGISIESAGNEIGLPSSGVKFGEIYFAAYRMAKAIQQDEEVQQDEKVQQDEDVQQDEKVQQGGVAQKREYSFQVWYAYTLMRLTEDRKKICSSYPEDDKILTDLLQGLKFAFYSNQKPEKFLQQIIEAKNDLQSKSLQRNSLFYLKHTTVDPTKEEKHYQNLKWSYEEACWKGAENDKEIQQAKVNLTTRVKNSTLLQAPIDIIESFLTYVFPKLDDDSKSLVRKNVITDWLQDTNTYLENYKKSRFPAPAKDRITCLEQLKNNLNSSENIIQDIQSRYLDYYNNITTALTKSIEDDRIADKKCSPCIWRCIPRNTFTGGRFQKALYKVRQQFLAQIFITLDDDKKIDIIKKEISATRSMFNPDAEKPEEGGNDTVGSKLAELKDLLDEQDRNNWLSSSQLQRQQSLYKIMEKSINRVNKSAPAQKTSLHPAQEDRDEASSPGPLQRV